MKTNLYNYQKLITNCHKLPPHPPQCGDLSHAGERYCSKPILTPQGNIVEFPNQVVEEKIREELTQIKGRGYKNAPNLSFVVTALDRTVHQRPEIIQEILKIAENDAILYWESDPQYLEKQHEIWKPLLGAANQKLGTSFKEKFDLSVSQLPEKDKKIIENWLTKLDDFQLTAFSQMASLCHSFLIPFRCVAFKNMSPADMLYAAELHEIMHMERWGMDSEVQKRHEQIGLDIEQVCQFWNDLRKDL